MGVAVLARVKKSLGGGITGGEARDGTASASGIRRLQNRYFSDFLGGTQKLQVNLSSAVGLMM